MQKKIFWISIFLLCLGFSLLVFIENRIENYYYLITSTSLIYLITIIKFKSIDLNRNYVYLIIFTVFIIKLFSINIHPIGSDDYYRYLWDGKVLASGINPFEFPPNAEELSHLTSEVLPDKVSFPHMRTIYFPLSQASFYLAYLIGAESIIGLKIIILLGDLLLTFFIIGILRKYNLKFTYILIYSLCPLFFYQFIIDLHIDIIGILFFAISVYFFNSRKMLSTVFFGASLAVKPVLIILIPLFLIFEKSWKTRFLWMVIPLLVLTILFIPFSLSGNTFESLQTFSKNWVFNGIVYNVIKSFGVSNEFSRLIVLTFFGISYLGIIIVIKDLYTAIYYAVLLLLIFSPVVHPWYVTWLIIPLILSFRYSGIIFISSVSLAFYTVLIYQNTGVWKDYTIVILIEYLPVIAVLFYEIYKIMRGNHLTRKSTLKY